MIEIRRILCPTDFSDFAGRALEHAVTLARWYEAEVTVLHVLPLMPVMAAIPPVAGPSYLPAHHKAVFHDLERFAVPARDAGVPVQLQTLEGAVPHQIAGVAQEIRADLVVMGTHGRGGFERWVLGSVTEKVVRKAPCPVLTVPNVVEEPRPAGAPFKRILCPVDFSLPSMKALEFALSLAEEAEGRLTLVHVLEGFSTDEPYGGPEVQRARRQVEADVRARLHAAVSEEARTWCEVDEVVLDGKAYRRVLSLAAESRAQLVVMGVHGRNPLDVMVFGSTTQQVLRGATCPVLTIRA